MTFYQIIAIAVALALDAFAVSVASGVCMGSASFRQVARLSWHFGFFQFMMSVIGWFGGLTVRDKMEDYAPWIAFGLLTYIAIKMIKGALEPEGEYEKEDPTRGWSLVMLSVATSVDALAAGFGLSLLKISIWYPSIIIGLTASAFTAAGLLLGCRVGSMGKIKSFAEVIGGSILLVIGAKILHTHGVFKGF